MNPSSLVAARNGAFSGNRVVVRCPGHLHVAYLGERGHRALHSQGLLRATIWRFGTGGGATVKFHSVTSVTVSPTTLSRQKLTTSKERARHFLPSGRHDRSDLISSSPKQRSSGCRLRCATLFDDARRSAHGDRFSSKTNQDRICCVPSALLPSRVLSR